MLSWTWTSRMSSTKPTHFTILFLMTNIILVFKIIVKCVLLYITALYLVVAIVFSHLLSPHGVACPPRLCYRLGIEIKTIRNGPVGHWCHFCVLIRDRLDSAHCRTPKTLWNGIAHWYWKLTIMAVGYCSCIDEKVQSYIVCNAVPWSG